MNKLLKLEKSLLETIGKYDKHLVKAAKPDPLKRQAEVRDIVQGALRSKLQSQSSDPLLNKHFGVLFKNLSDIQSSKVLSNAEILAHNNTSEDIIRLFDSMYYQSLTTFNMACTVLKDRRIKTLDDINHFCRIIDQGGTILRKWTLTQRESFQLIAANKMWISNLRVAAVAKLKHDYTNIWKNRLVSDPELNADFLYKLARALIDTRAVPIEVLVANNTQNWRNLAVFWRISWDKFPYHLISSKPQFVAALEYTTNKYTKQDLLRNSDFASLNFVPVSAKSAFSEWEMALYTVASQIEDTKLMGMIASPIPYMPSIDHH